MILMAQEGHEWAFIMQPFALMIFGFNFVLGEGGGHVDYITKIHMGDFNADTGMNIFIKMRTQLKMTDLYVDTAMNILIKR